MHNYSHLVKFFRKIIFDPYMTITRVHPVQISSRSDDCINTDIMQKTPKMLKQ